MDIKLNAVTDITAVTCPLCLDVFEKPCRIACGHVFCENCLKHFTAHAAAQCPNCRQPFDAHRYQRDSQTEHILRFSCATCEGCSKQILLMQYSSHVSTCDKAAALQRQRLKDTTIDSPVVRGPNRHTFQCPYCDVKNLEGGSLRDHCISKHAHNTQPVVCPICASMPWGDKTLTSSNFIRHLSLRHQFEYDTYVDYEQDDDAMLRAAIDASLAQM